MQALCDLGEPATIPSIAAFLLDDDATVAWEASVTMQVLVNALPLALLPTLDERMRASPYRIYHGDRWARLRPEALGRLPSGVDVSLVFCLASFHSSGYVRERAVVLLGESVTSGSELPFLLLRLVDWVDPVRIAAERALDSRLTEPNRPALLGCLPLIVRIGNRSRAGSSAIFGRLQVFLQGGLRALVDAAVSSSESGARHYGLSLAWADASTKGEAMQREVIEQLVVCSNPAARLAAAVWVADSKTPPALPQRFLTQLVHDRFVAVRRVALGWCAMREPLAHLATLREALLDLSSVVRSIAQFYLPKYEPIDLRRFYREAINSGDARVLPAAIGGLGEIGQADDADLIVPFTEARRVGIRQAALAALGRLALSAHLELFVKALQDESPGVSRQARIALEVHVCSIGNERLAAIISATDRPHVRVQVLSLINRLPKWEKLPLLIQIAGEQQGDLKLRAVNFLRDWSFNYNRTHFARPTKAEVCRLRDALVAHEASLNRETLRDMRALADCFS